MRFLSPEWLARLGASMSGAAPVDVRLAVHQHVTGGPDGDVEYTLRLEGGSVTVAPGPAGPARPDVEIVQDYDTAAAISQGRLSPAAAFAAGRLRLVGSVDLLIANQDALSALGPPLGGLAAATTY